MSNSFDNQVELKVPVNPDYVSVVRLLVSGLGTRLGLPLDEIEDLKLAIGEAFMSLVEKCDEKVAGLLQLKWKQDGAHISVSLSDPSGKHRSIASLALVKELGGQYTTAVVDGVPHLDIAFDIKYKDGRPQIFNERDGGRA